MRAQPVAATLAMLSIVCACVLGAGATPVAVRPATTAIQALPESGEPAAEPAPSQPPITTSRLVPVEPPRFPDEEDPDPWAVAMEGRGAWRIYAVDGAGEPKQVYESLRFLGLPEWTPDGRIDVRALSRGARAVAGPGRPPETAERLWLDALVSVAPSGSSWEVVVSRMGRSERSPDGRFVAFDLLDTGASGRTRSQVYVLAEDGRAWRAEGQGLSLWLEGWQPDGAALLLGHERGPGGVGPLYLLPLDGTPAGPLVDRVTGPIGWSPDGGSLAFIAEGDLVVLDRASGRSRTLTSGGRYRALFAPLRWSPDGGRVLAGADVIDGRTGVTVASAWPPEETIDAAFSPDGGRLAATQEPRGPWPGVCTSTDALGVAPQQIPLTNRTAVADLLTGEVRTLRDCGDGFHAFVEWLGDGRHLLLISTNCWQCGGGRNRVTLVDTETGAGSVLVEEPGLSVHPSPTRDRVLITGDALRLFDTAGHLLREIAPPPGFEVTEAAWLADGSRFVYVVGPRNFRFP